MCAALRSQVVSAGVQLFLGTNLSGFRMAQAKRVRERVVSPGDKPKRVECKERLGELLREGAAVLAVDEGLDDILDIAAIDVKPLLVLERSSCKLWVRLCWVKAVDEALDEDEKELVACDVPVSVPAREACSVAYHHSRLR